MLALGIAAASAVPALALGPADPVNGPAVANRTAAPVSPTATDVVSIYNSGELRPDVVAKAKLCLYDLLSSALAAGELPWSRQSAAIARANSGAVTSGAAIIGTADVVSIHDAAFANGVRSHGLVRDDMHVGSVSHLGTVLIPTLLALAHTTKASGKDLLTALVAGYEAGGFINPHRDNSIPTNARRRFTMTVNLNAGEYDGGELRFREYGEQLYAVERGTAIVWSASLLHEVLPVTQGRRLVLGVHMFAG